jgi:hypothetical protein
MLRGIADPSRFRFVQVRQKESAVSLPPAVQRDAQAFWSDPARVEKFKKDAMTLGWFIVLDLARANREIGPDLFAYEYRRYYNQTLAKVREALKETEHVRKALKRMEAAAQQGAHRHAARSLREHPDDQNFKEGLRLFQAWLASLYESYVTLYCYVYGSNDAYVRIRQFASASWNLIHTREQEQVLTSRHAELFKSLYER